MHSSQSAKLLLLRCAGVILVVSGFATSIITGRLLVAWFLLLPIGLMVLVGTIAPDDHILMVWYTSFVLSLYSMLSILHLPFLIGIDLPKWVFLGTKVLPLCSPQGNPAGCNLYKTHNIAALAATSTALLVGCYTRNRIASGQHQAWLWAVMRILFVLHGANTFCTTLYSIFVFGSPITLELKLYLTTSSSWVLTGLFMGFSAPFEAASTTEAVDVAASSVAAGKEKRGVVGRLSALRWPWSKVHGEALV